jgi:superfamily II DNA/RNA helicase
VDARKKKDVLRDLLNADDVNTAIIFCNRKTTVRELAQSLQRSGFRATEIHGDMEQSARIKELDRFKSGDINILVASDVAARGLDIKGVSHVFNFDAPWHPDDYVHRIGRTGRAGATGKAFTFVTSADAEAIENIEKLTGQTLTRIKGSGESAAKAAPSSPEAADVAADDQPRPARRSRAKAAPKVEEAKAPAPKPERDEKPERAARKPQEKPAPRREVAQPSDESNDTGGWNGPMPDFLSHGFN